MWSWWQLVPGRIPLRAKNTARGEPMQKKFSTCEVKNIDNNIEIIKRVSGNDLGPYSNVSICYYLSTN